MLLFGFPAKVSTFECGVALPNMGTESEKEAQYDCNKQHDNKYTYAVVKAQLSW